MHKNRNNTVGLVAVVSDTPQIIRNAPEWEKKVYETMVTLPRRNGKKTEDRLILQYTAAAAANTQKQLTAIKKGVEVLIIGRIRTQNVPERKITEPSVKIYIEAEVVQINDPPAARQNKVALKGNVCKEPFLRETKKGIHVVSLMVAVSNEQGQASFIPCICWDDVANIAATLSKGTYVEVFGRMRSREFKKMIEGRLYTMTAYEVAVAKLGIDASQIGITKG